MIKMVYDEKTKTWKEWKEWEKPYATIEAESEEALEYLEQRIEKQKAKKLVFNVENTLENGMLCFYCPRCGTLLFGQDIRSRRNYCFECGQKLDWSDVNGSKRNV